MKTVRLLLVLGFVMSVSAWLCPGFAEESSITLPKGTKIEKLGPGHFKFKLPNPGTMHREPHEASPGYLWLQGDVVQFVNLPEN